MIETLLSLGGTALTAYSTVSGIKQGKQFNEIVSRLEAIHATIETLSSNILYAPSIQIVSDLSQNKQQTIDNLREVRQSLEPIQKTLGKRIISSNMILSPQKTQHAMKRDPWEVLTNIRPLNKTKIPNDPDMVPITFEHEGIYYTGWQKVGTLPLLFNFEYNTENELWSNASSISKTFLNRNKKNLQIARNKQK
jgi:hypothetical protein